MSHEPAIKQVSEDANLGIDKLFKKNQFTSFSFVVGVSPPTTIISVCETQTDKLKLLTHIGKQDTALFFLFQIKKVEKGGFK